MGVASGATSALKGAIVGNDSAFGNFVYVAVPRARGLITPPGAKGGPSAFVSVRLGKHKERTDTTPGVDPEFGCDTSEFSFQVDVQGDPGSVDIKVWHEQALGKQCLGECLITQIPTAERPSVEGWFSLTASLKHRAKLNEFARAMGRPEGDLGEVFVCMSRGSTRKPPSEMALRPDMRERLGRLTVRIYEARDLPAMDITGTSDPYVRARLEATEYCTDVVYKSLNPTWEAEFEFKVTEVSDDLLLTVYDKDVASTDDVIGEAVVPLHHLLCAVPLKSVPGRLLRKSGTYELVPTWVQILKRRKRDEPFMGVHYRPRKSLGELRISATFELDDNVSLAHAFCGPAVLPHSLARATGSTAEGASARKFSRKKAVRAAERLGDAAAALAVMPLRTVLYLQLWAEPKLNAVVLVSLVTATLFAWRVVCAVWPVGPLLLLALNVYVARQIHANDPVIMHHEEEEEALEAAAALDAERTKLMLEEKKAVAAAERELEEAGLSEDSKEGGLLLGKVLALLAKVQEAVSKAADGLERVESLLSGSDPFATALFIGLSALVATVTALGYWVIRLALWLSPVGLRHVVLVAGLACLVPFPRPVRHLLDDLDSLARLAPMVKLRSFTAGSGLEASRRVAKKLETPEQMRERIRAAADRRAQAAAERRANRLRILKNAGLLRDMDPREAIPKLLHRAGVKAHATHRSIAGRAIGKPAPEQ